MKLRYDFEIVDMGDEQIAVPVGAAAEQLQGVLKLNKEGAEILGLLKENTSEEKIVDVLGSKYEINREIIAGYVHEMIGKLYSFGVVE